MAAMIAKNAHGRQPILPGSRGEGRFALNCNLRLKSLARPLWLLAYACSSVLVIAADPDHCGVCGKPFGATVYTVTDKVTREKVFLCYECARCPDECYICGLPAKTDPTKLPDGRLLCARDAKTAVMDEAKAKEICEGIRDTLDRKFSRFLTLPATNVAVALVDRVSLYDEFVVEGNSFECPDVLGYIHSRTNNGGLSHSISLMSALPRAEFQAACAHEYAHAWVFENVSAERRKRLSRDAHEGFCELLAYLLMDSLHEEEQMKRMLRNTYTRGQINLFIAAEKQHGFNDVLDWMRWGANPHLKAADLGDVRNVEMPRPKSSPPGNPLIYGQRPAPAPATLLLKGISSARNQPLALINDQTFAVGESAKVRVGTSNVWVRCLAVGPRSVRIREVDSGKETELFLADSAGR
jgi:hypothetical protein